MRKAFLTSLVLISSCVFNSESDTPPSVEIAPPPPPPIQNAVHMYEKGIQRTFESVEKFNIETPIRCSVDWNNQPIINVEPYNRRDFHLERADKGDKLPDISVKDLTVKNQTADQIIRELLKNTGIRLYYSDTFTQKISLDAVSGNLEQVLDLIATQSSVYYSFDNRAQKLTLRRFAKWNLHVPLSKEVMLAMEDALRGADIDDIVIDWEDRFLIFNGNFLTENTVRNIIGKFAVENYLIAYDMDIYRIEPKGKNIEWIGVLDAFNKDTIKLSQKGVIGRLLVVADSFNRDSLTEFLAPRAKMTLISTGSFISPERWQGRFDIGRCSKDNYIETDLSVMTESRFTPTEANVGRLDSTIVLRTISGDIAKYSVPSRLSDNFLIIGIPTQYFAKSGQTDIAPNAELVALISPRIIKIAKPN